MVRITLPGEADKALKASPLSTEHPEAWKAYLSKQRISVTRFGSHVRVVIDVTPDEWAVIDAALKRAGVHIDA